MAAPTFAEKDASVIVAWPNGRVSIVCSICARPQGVMALVSVN